MEGLTEGSTEGPTAARRALPRARQSWHHFLIADLVLAPLFVMKSTASRSANSARCPRCGSAFDCGMRAPSDDCWCRQMPPLPADRLERSRGCLCPQCLAAEIARAAQDAGTAKAVPGTDLG